MNEQEEFWAGDFGSEYTQRNVGRIFANMAYFRSFLPDHLDSLIEFGAGGGENLQAIKSIRPNIKLAAVEINRTAVAKLKFDMVSEVFKESMLTFSADREWEATMTKGVLIHIAPENLRQAYTRLFDHSSRYIIIAEYFSKQPREVDYRGHAGKLWTRDFGGEFLDQHPDCKLRKCFFSYDRLTGQDSITTWVIEK